MPSNQTANYALNQWSKDDRVLMDDFNADNAKIDEALSGLAQTAAGHTAELAQKGNCQIYFTTYIADSTAQKTLDFPHKPIFIAAFQQGIHLFTAQGLSRASMRAGGSFGGAEVSWSGNSVTLSKITHFSPGDTVVVVALLDAAQ